MKHVRNVLVTGGTGFLGSALMPLLLKEGFHVTSLQRKKIKPYRSVRYVFSFEEAAIKKSLRGQDAVIHGAASVKINDSLARPREAIEENIDVLFDLLEAIRQSSHRPLVILASTDRSYGKVEGQATEGSPVFPLEPYTASKLIAETLLQLYGHLYGIPYVILRFDSIYGPHQPRSMFISDAIQKMMQSDEVLFGNLLIKKNFVYVEDAAAACVKALRVRESGRNQIYNIGGDFVPLKEIAEIIKRLFLREFKREIRIRFDLQLVRKDGTEVKPFRLSRRKAKQILDWAPATRLEEGILHTVRYFMNKT